MHKKVSVIMPVYNVSKYLVQAMESAINQTYDNYEIICIDDGSTDASGHILDEYSKYEKVTVVHKKNTGYGNSMNIGLSMATGDYISILEPDDYIEKDTLKSIMEIIDENGDIDVVKCNFFQIRGEKELEVIPTKVLKDSSKYGRVLKGEEILCLYLGYIAHWTAVYRRDFLDKNGIRYNETPGASYQDIGMWFQTTMFAQSAYLFDRCFYNYRADNPGSSMNNPGKVFCTCDEYDFVESKITKEQKERINPYYIKCRIIAAKDTYRRISPEHRLNFLKRVADDFESIKKKGLLDFSRVNEDDRELIEDILKSYESVYQEKEEECRKFFAYIADTKSFYIYGAGNLATFIYRLLSEDDRKKLMGFIVTKCNGERAIVDKPVVSFDSVKDEAKSMPIGIGVSNLYASEIRDYLRENDIENVFVFKGGIV